MKNKFQIFAIMAICALFAGCKAETQSLFSVAGGGGGGGTGTGGGGTGTGGGGTGGANEPQAVFAPGQVNGFGAVIIAGDSSKIVFTDDSDTLGTNPGEEWQIWSVDLARNDLTQITTAEPSAFSFSTEIDTSDNGDQVVFVTSSDLAGVNPNNMPNVFIAATDGSSITQVTSINAGASGAREAVISGDGSLIAFESDDDLTGGNPALVGQIFTINADGSNLTQITNQNIVPRNIDFADNGASIAFQGAGDPFGLNPNGWEIFTVGVDGSNLTQVTMSPGDSLGPELSDDGSRVIFTSNGDLVPGANGDGSFEVFVGLTNGGGFTQISDGVVDTGGGCCNPPTFSISGDGNFVAFTSTADFTGENPAGEPTIFWGSATGGAVNQLLRMGTVADAATQRDASTPSLNNNGALVSFVSFVNYTSITQPGSQKLYTIARQ